MLDIGRVAARASILTLNNIVMIVATFEEVVQDGVTSVTVMGVTRPEPLKVSTLGRSYLRQ